jgi:hypothetical protein
MCNKTDYNRNTSISFTPPPAQATPAGTRARSRGQTYTHLDVTLGHHERSGPAVFRTSTQFRPVAGWAGLPALGALLAPAACAGPARRLADACPESSPSYRKADGAIYHQRNVEFELHLKSPVAQATRH